MGARGPAPKPTSLRVLHGDRKDRTNTSEPRPSDRPVVAPAWLVGYALEVWERLADELVRLGVLKWTDADAFAAYCTAVARLRDATETLAREGLTIPTKSGIAKHPAATAANEATSQIRALGTHFGLTPSGRAQLRTEQPEDADDLARRLLS
jgi:P27 family predicted phage terminase small subunit